MTTPNGQMIEQLEALLEEAKSGQLVSIALAGMRDHGGSFYSFTVVDPVIVIGQLEVLKKRLLDLVEAKATKA